MKIEIKKALLEGYTPEVIITEAKNWSDKQRGTFLRRGIDSASNYTPQQFAVSLAPAAGAIAGGAIGNQIHGSDGTIGGLVYDDQLHNDDEFDGTGALLGAGLGIVANHVKGVGTQKGNAVVKRLKDITGNVNNQEKIYGRVYGNAAHVANNLAAASQLIGK